MSYTRPLWKLAYAEEFIGDTEPRTAAYIDVCEDSSTGSTHKLPAEVEFPKRSTVIYDKRALDDKTKLTAAKLVDKAQKLCNELAINPIHPNSKRLYRDLVGKRSIRINLQHRLVYEILEDKKIIKIFRMWGYYD